ncbi:TetR family transcriptional regulator [Nonomuraea glycinis]|jgi:AcrR family transcriptional regulator|nr:TetR family transcriptional regulator [Nonomuraea glycinis]MCA2175376.1 TetR family transcriptional regulator [Nonomuraea glycinis]WSG63736.1 TetR family transcriptional regulator [Nonomuraea glycinis]
MAQRKSRSDRRIDLIEAARRAIIKHGVDGVQLSHVAEEARLTSGAVLYHYPDLGELLVEAQHSGMERFYEQRLRQIAALTDPATKLVLTIKSGLPTGPLDPDVRLLNELGGAAGRHRVYGVLLTSLYDRQVSMYQSILDTGSALGVFRLTADALSISRNLVALEDAYGYRITARHPLIGPEEAAELILSYARTVTGNDLLH